MAPAVADLKAMTDAFEGIDKLAEGAPRTDGAPNFRRVNTDTKYKYKKRALPGQQGNNPHQLTVNMDFIKNNKL